MSLQEPPAEVYACAGPAGLFKCTEYSPLTGITYMHVYTCAHISWFTCKKKQTMQRAVYDPLISTAFRCKGAVQWSCSADFHLALRIESRMHSIDSTTTLLTWQNWCQFYHSLHIINNQNLNNRIQTISASHLFVSSVLLQFTVTQHDTAFSIFWQYEKTHPSRNQGCALWLSIRYCFQTGLGWIVSPVQ